VDLSRAGARVAFNFSRDEEGAAVTRALVEEQGSQVLSFKVSVLDGMGLKNMVKETEATWGAIDILVNNAGMSQPLPIALLDEGDWDLVMDVNTKGHFLATHAVLRGMIRRKSGCILNIGSLAGERLIEAPVHYCASKAAISGFTRALSKEVARYGIRVNCLAPGLLDEGVSQNLPRHRLEEFLKHVSLRRQGTFEEVSRFATFLVSERNSYMNGETILIDGGL
jgi:NAD(P)-dependent dehydrogenase (short-subunit alcohol dehydrogenase family)